MRGFGLILPPLILLQLVAAAQQWVPQNSHTAASLRGISAVSRMVAWASGTQGAYVRTTDGGGHWTAGQAPGATELDFRGIYAVDASTAFLMSAGDGEKSRVYRTVDGGATWALLFTNPDPKGFFDAIAFWDRRAGILLGDPVNGIFTIFTTEDGGRNWRRGRTPAALASEGAFAASNSCLLARGTAEAWFVTGGTGGGRVFHTRDRGEHWTVAATPMRNDGASAGIFSAAFAGSNHGMITGGDYARDKEPQGNLAGTRDGGKSWTPLGNPRGFRSAIAYLPCGKIWIVTGTSGSDFSRDGGRTWQGFDDGAYNALGFAGDAGWAVGPKGRIARYEGRAATGRKLR